MIHLGPFSMEFYTPPLAGPGSWARQSSGVLAIRPKSGDIGYVVSGLRGSFCSGPAVVVSKHTDILMVNLVNLMANQIQSQFAIAPCWSSGVFRLTVQTIAIVLLLANPLVAQGGTQDDIRRAVPAPWRPAFGSVNKSAAQQQTDEVIPPAGANSAVNSNGSILSQPQRPPANPNPGSGTRQAGSDTRTTGPGTRPVGSGARIGPPNRAAAVKPGVTRVSSTMNQLPNKAGQVWREYDISPYTTQITSTDQPEKAVLDWVLRETGTEMWFTQPMGVLNVGKSKLFVYHTPEIQSVVKEIVDRLVRTKGQVQTVDVNLITVAKANWRSQAYTMLQPIEVKSPGVEAWLVSKENAAILMGQLSRRSDFKQHSSGRLNNHDGQSFSIDKTRPLQFVRSLRWTPGQAAGYQPLLTTVNEGYKLQLSCLTTTDNASIEAMIKCDVDQVEKLENVSVAVPAGAGGAQQKVSLQVPQMVSWRLQERFRWPSDEVLVLSCGVVATPDPDARKGGLRLPGISGAKRADALLFIDYRGPATGATIATVPNRDNFDRTASNRMGRISN